MILKFAIIFLSALAYATIRYVLLGPTPVDQIPIYIVNKALALSAVIILTMLVISIIKRNEAAEHFWIKCVTGTVTVHIILSLAILSSRYYPKLFINDPQNIRLSLLGGLSILSGALAFYTFTRNKKGQTPQRQIIILSILLSLILLHIVFMEFTTWFHPSLWAPFGGLPPITMVAGTFSIIALTLGIMTGIKLLKVK